MKFKLNILKIYALSNISRTTAIAFLTSNMKDFAYRHIYRVRRFFHRHFVRQLFLHFLKCTHKVYDSVKSVNFLSSTILNADDNPYSVQYNKLEWLTVITTPVYFWDRGEERFSVILKSAFTVKLDVDVDVDDQNRIRKIYF